MWLCYGLEVWVSLCSRDKWFFSLLKHLDWLDPNESLFSGYWKLFHQAWSSHSMNLPTYCHQGLRLRMGELLPLFAIVVCIEAVLHLPFQLVSVIYLLLYNFPGFLLFSRPASIYYPSPVPLIIGSLQCIQLLRKAAEVFPCSSLYPCSCFSATVKYCTMPNQNKL